MPMLKKFTTLCAIFLFNYIFFTDQKNNVCHMTGSSNLTTKVNPNITTEIMGQQGMKFYKDVFGEKIVDQEDFIRRNVKFITDHSCDLKLKTVVVGTNTIHTPKLQSSELFGYLKTHSPIPYNYNITIVGTKRVSLSTLTEQYAVYNTFSKYNLKGSIYTDTVKMTLTEQQKDTVSQKHPDCSFYENNPEEIIYYDVKQKPLELKTTNHIIPITFRDDKQISGTTHYTQMEMYLKKKFQVYSMIIEKSGSPRTRELFESFKSSTHLTYVERLDLSNRLTLSLLKDNKTFSGEIACIFECNNQEEFRGNFDSIRKNFSELPSPSEPQKNAIVYRQFVKDNIVELMPLFKQNRGYLPPFIDTLL